MPDIKDHKSKKNKRKQAMADPVDLEAGNHAAEPEAPSIAKAVYQSSSNNDAANPESVVEVTDTSVVGLLDGDRVTGISTPVESKGIPKIRKAPIPLSSKAKVKLFNTETATEVTQASDTGLTSADATGAETSKIVADSGKAPISDHGSAPTNVAGRKALYEFLQVNRTVKKAKVPIAAEPPEASTVMKINAKKELYLVPMVSAWSYDPDLPTKSKITEAATVKDSSRQQLSLVSLVSVSSTFPEPSRESSAKKGAAAKVASDSPHPQNTNNLHGLPPFDHKYFSRFDNIPRPSIK